MSHCSMDSDCPWQYFCTPDLKCEHDPIFPLKIYPIFIYLLMPIASGLVNMTGNSMGIFNVLILMNLLRYDVDVASVFIQPMVSGTALPNFFNIILKRHPRKNSSLVDYNIVYILIPCCLLGSTLGAFIENFIPQIVQDILVVLFFAYFAFNFWKKLKSMKEENTKGESVITQPNKQTLLNKEQQDLNEQQQEMKQKIQKYQSTIHLPDILASFGVFVVFQFFVFLVQGKFSFYKIGKCDALYYIGIVLLAVLTVGYLFIIKKKHMKTFKNYEEVNYQPNINLSDKKTFVMIALGGLSAGLVQGILGVGSGTFIMGVLLAYNLDPRVASATSGYQIFFIGAASFIEGFINGKIQLQDAALLFGVCAILGGLVTFGMYKYLKNKNPVKVNRLLVTIIFILCMISVIGVFPSTILNVVDFGWDRLIHIKFHC